MKERTKPFLQMRVRPPLDVAQGVGATPIIAGLDRLSPNARFTFSVLPQQQGELIRGPTRAALQAKKSWATNLLATPAKLTHAARGMKVVREKAATHQNTYQAVA